MDNRRKIVLYINNDPKCNEIIQLIANHVNDVKSFVRTDIVNVTDAIGKTKAQQAGVSRVPTMILAKIPPQVIVGATDIRAAYMTIVRTCQDRNRVSVPTPDQEILNMQMAVLGTGDEDQDEGQQGLPSTAEIQRRVLEEAKRRGMAMERAVASMPSAPKKRVYNSDADFVTDAGVDHSIHDNVGDDGGGGDYDLDDNDLHEYLKDASRNG